MTNSDAILILERDSERRQALRAVLACLGLRPVVADVDNLATVVTPGVGDAEPLLAVVGGGAAVPAELLSRYPHLPVVAVDGAPADGIEPWRMLAALAYPASVSQWLDCLYLARRFRQQLPAGLQHSAGERAEDGLVGTSAAIQGVRDMVAKVAAAEVTVLITGPSGSGKEVVARELHRLSPRQAAPFVPVNCGAIPRELLESELFGHERGAFTGASAARAGRFELAEGGTLFLDEIGDMPLDMQVKILRVLQERSFERVGSNTSIRADVRIVAATHKNLEQMIADGSFREDLYYRLNVFPIEMPALRDRAEDIPALLHHLIARLERERRGSVKFNSRALAELCRYPWPGNIRELANLVERMAILHPGEVVGLADLPPRFVSEAEEEDAFELLPQAAPGAALPLPEAGLDLKETLEQLEQGLIEQALESGGGVVTRAAELLRIRRTTLVEKMRKYGLMPARQ